MTTTYRALPDAQAVAHHLELKYGAVADLESKQDDCRSDGFIDANLTCDIALLWEEIKATELLLKASEIIDQICAAQAAQKRIYCEMRQWRIIILKAQLDVLA
jgi:hypothetical protein